MKAILSLWLPEEKGARAGALKAAAVVGGLFFLVVYLVIKHRTDWPQAAARFAARGNSLRVELVALEFVWKALVVNAALLAVLLATVRWWASPATARVEEVKRPGQPQTLAWVLVLLIIGVAVGVRAPRLSLSLYNDEAHNYTRLWSGDWQEKDGVTRLDEPRWGKTLFWNEAGNNSQLFSLAARGCLVLAENAGWRIPGEVTEWAVRVPSLLAGLASLVVLGLLARRRWGTEGLLIAMLVLAVHPWHVRYSTEARGYSFMLLGIALMLWFADRAVSSGRWRDWAGYAAGLFLCAVSFLGSVYFMACFSVGLLWHQWGRAKKLGDWSLLARPLVASVGAAMAGLVLLWPMIPPLLKVLEEHHSIRGEMGLRWWQDVAGYLMAGTRWLDAAPENPVNLALARWAGETGGWMLPACWIGLCLLGLRGLWIAGGVPRVLAWSTPAALLMAWLLMSRKGNFLNHWYVLYAVPWVVMTLTAGAAQICRRKRPVGLVILGLALIWPARAALALRTLPKQHERTPVMEALGAVYPGEGRTAPRPLLGAFWCNSTLYHPEVIALRDVAGLKALEQRAREEGRPLYVCFSHRGPALANDSALVKAVENEAVFEKVAVYPGQEESQYSMHLFKLRH